jgi:predicted O-methyltransferase YrrM
MINKDIIEYIEVFSSTAPEYLRELEKETYIKTVLPQMISGEYQGRLLSLFSKMIKPKKILEIGTFTGYSALCLAEGLESDGELHTIDINEEYKYLQDIYFRKSGYGNQITQHTGNALDIIPQLDMEFDLIFLDADKKNYPTYFNLLLPKLKKGGILLADNVLWYGKVSSPDISDPETDALRKYNEMLVNNPQVEVIILPVRDGLSVARKK